MTTAETLTASLEDYLEAIFHIIAEKRAARPKDIARRLKVSNPSVTGALRLLAKKKLVNYAPYDLVTLTGKGEEAARDVIRRHEVLRDFFVKVLAVEQDVADKAACKMEHSIPGVILERFIQFAEFVEVCPRGGSKWIAGFGYHCDYDSAMENCEKCIAQALEEVKKKKRQGGKKKMPVTKLKDIPPGGKCKVNRVAAGKASSRIIEMGVVPGALIEVEKIAPLGDPIDIKVKGYHLSLRKEEADGIDVTPLNAR